MLQNGYRWYWSVLCFFGFHKSEWAGPGYYYPYYRCERCLDGWEGGPTTIIPYLWSMLIIGLIAAVVYFGVHES